MHDWPILIFTIMFSAAVGLTGLIVLFGAVLKKELSDVDLYPVLRTPLLVASGLAVISLAVSFAAIGYPLNAPNALRHLTTSALSREIAFASVFIAAIGGTTFLALRSRKVSLVLVAASFLIGLLTVWFMGEIYRNTSVVTWMHAHTHVMFFGGLMLMGAVLGLALVGPAIGDKASAGTMGRLFAWTAVLVLIGLASQLVVLPSYIMDMNANPMNGVVSYPLQSLGVFEAHAGMRAARWAVSLVGTAVLLWAAWRAVRSSERKGFALVVAAGLLLISGEVVGRYAFYAIYG